MFDPPECDDLLLAALAEDLGVEARAMGIPDPSLLARDVTGAAVLAEGVRFKGVVAARAHGVVCGLPYVQRVYALLASAAAAEPVEVFPLVAEGAFAEPGEAVLSIDGEARLVLAGERTALDLLMTLSGIATAASRWQEEAGDSLRVVDTRKTLPGLRAVSKYAVRVGGATNHRQGLWDMVLIKDNHIAHAGGIGPAVAAARVKAPGLAVQVEADTVEQAREAASAGADMVLLDNMDDRTLAEAVRVVREIADETGREVLTEASGGMVIGRIAALRSTLVDRVSTSAITLAPPVDFGLDERQVD